jgi:DHA2 family multidrug resistance protein
MEATEQWQPGVRPWFIALTMVFPTFVANVVLPHIAGSLSASIDEATWALTSSLKASSRRGAGVEILRGR